MSTSKINSLIAAETATPFETIVWGDTDAVDDHAFLAELDAVLRARGLTTEEDCDGDLVVVELES